MKKIDFKTTSLYNHGCFGSLAERLNAPVLKTGKDASPS